MPLFIEALSFAASKHRLQRRKDNQSPYINHLIDVARLLWFEGGVRDTELLIAGLLHDCLEDTETTAKELEDSFGDRVRSLVEEVSDDKTLDKAQRKALVVQLACTRSPGAKQLLLADKCSNLKDLLLCLPEGWTIQRARDYFFWVQAILGELQGSNSGLESACEEVLQQGLSGPFAAVV